MTDAPLTVGRALDRGRRFLDEHGAGEGARLDAELLLAHALGCRRLDLLLSNPPYVAEGTYLPREVRREPPEALFAGPDGLAAIRRIVAAAPLALRPGGLLLCEIGAGQADAVRALAVTAGLADGRLLRDLARVERVLSARSPAG